MLIPTIFKTLQLHIHLDHLLHLLHLLHRHKHHNMHTIRRLSGAWASSQTLCDPEPPPSKHRPRHRHHCSHQKNYDALPLGGNRPIALATTAVDRMTIVSDREAAREHHHREHTPRRSRSKSPHSRTKSRSSTASLDSEKSSKSHCSRKSRKEVVVVTGTRGSDKQMEMHGSSASPPIEEAAGGGVIVAAPAMESHGSVSSISSESSTSSPTSAQRSSSMGIVISEGRKRRGTNDTDTNIPIITATPPTPSPLEQARHRNTHPLTSSPPYPVTPPVMQSRTTDYIAYHPPNTTTPSPPPNLGTQPALRAGSPRPRAYSSPPSHPAVEIGSSDSIPQHKPSTREDPYLLLRRFDTILIIDDSASMTAHWAATRSALETLATVALRHDQDGIDIHFMNHPEHDAVNVKSAVHIRRLFAKVEPEGCTPTGQCLDEILREYIDRYASTKAPASPSSSPSSHAPPGVKPLNILVLTDGEPTDDPEPVIVSAARKLEALNAPLHQVGIQFLQIGDEEGAREALEELDDALEGVYGIRDMVDTTRYVGEGEEISGQVVLKALLGGINRRLDRRRL
ncbi:hypothetical protein K440DRAFT_593911 [Wilcoxina mikolae CBS 423.85]|nr:hypothetical protein K440DRAFT_593911 [Wilcoxina mikolae CBS 423.85]